MRGASARKKESEADIIRYADMFAAMGTEARLRIVRLLLAAHPDGMVVGEIGSELGVLPSTLSHHLEKLKNEDLVRVRREGTFLWYSANTDTLQDLLGFLYAECCTRNKAVRPEAVVPFCK
ncbi:MAG: winged helix-turn-helix transcriptional regulator [Bryobacteraceae bacterium]|nr:winged helix-turn-helix transcriptional regulator [Bryobacteraceae bacterium]